jgi:hypothetical protein
VKKLITLNNPFQILFVSLKTSLIFCQATTHFIINQANARSDILNSPLLKLEQMTRDLCQLLKVVLVHISK